jgi:hypothetical protein
MTALTNLSDMVNRLTGGNSGTPEQLWFFVNNRVAGAAAAATVANRITSLWEYEKNPGGSGAQPTTSSIPTNATNGGLFQTDPGGGREKWLLGLGASSSVAGALILYDRLVHMGGLSGTTTTAQTTNLPTTALTRNTGGVGNQIFVEIYTQIGTTATTATVDYKNQAGTLKTSKAFDIGATNLREAQRIIQVPLADGDTGVTTIENFDLLASTGTAGNIGMCIARPLAMIPINSSGAGASLDLISGFPAMVEIDTDACLALAFLSQSTTAPIINGQLSMIES